MTDVTNQAALSTSRPDAGGEATAPVTTNEQERTPARPRDLALVIALVALGDGVLLKVPPNLSLAAYLSTLGLVVLVIHRFRVGAWWALLVPGAIAPLANAPSPASVALALAALVAFAFARGGAPLTSGGRVPLRLARMVGLAPIDAAKALAGLRLSAARGG